MLTILIGRAKTQKSERILRQIADLGDTTDQILLVPEHASHASEVDLCRACGDTASRHAEVLSFRRLASRVLALTGGLSDVTLDQGGKLLTLQRALYEVAPAMKVYRRPSRRASFLQELLTLFDELNSYQVTPEALADTAKSTAGATRDKLEDLSLLYGDYQARLHRPGLDARDRMSKLCDHLEESRYIDGKDIFIDGFTYFNAQEEQAISVFLRRARSVTVTLLGEQDGKRNELFDVSYRTRDALLRLAEKSGSRCELVYTGETDASQPLNHLERCFFGENRTWEGATDAIRLREAADMTAEVEQTAAEIRRLTAAGKCRYREITVAARHLSVYEATIESVFERYGIPAYWSRRSAVLDTPAVALLLGALAAVSGDFEYEDVFCYLKTGLAGLTPEECDQLENYVLTWDIRGSLWKREEPWTANPDGYGAPWEEAQVRSLENLNALRQRVRAPLIFLMDGLKDSDTVNRKVEILYRFMEQLSLQQALEGQMRRLAAAGQMQRAEETAQLWDTLCLVLDQFVEILGEEALETEEFVRLLRQILTQYSVGTIPVSLDQVLISEITRNDRHSVKYLFLLGANDHELPSVDAGGGILNDDDRDELVSRGIRLAPRGMEQMSLELQNLYAALAQPTEGLYVSYPDRDASGAELRPSFLIGRVQTLFPSVPLEHSKSDKEYRLTAIEPALEAAGQWPDSTLWRFFEGQETFRTCLAAMRRAKNMSRGRLSSPAVKALYGDRFYLSASRLERLNSCHFSYFMEYGLRARQRTDSEFDAPQIGTFAHFVLENVARETMRLGGFSQVADDRLEAMTRTYIAQYAEREFSNFQGRSFRFRYLFKRLESAVFSMVREAAEELRHSDFVPLEFELSFGDHGTLPAVSIREPDGELRVTGKVDRVDGWIRDGRLYVRVVDYKTGRKSFQLSEVRMGLDIQMLLYLFTLQQESAGHFGVKTVEPAGVLYLPARDDILSAERNVTPEKLLAMRAKTLQRSGLVLNDPGVLQAMEREALTEPRYLPVRVNRSGDLTGAVASAAQLGKLKGYVERLLHQITRELRDGKIDADPCCHSEEDALCRYCPWAPACQFEDGRGTDRLRYITPVRPGEFWDELDAKESEAGDHE